MVTCDTAASPEEPAPPPAPRAHFFGFERLVVLTGGSAFGLLVGMGVAMTIGHQEMWPVLFVSALLIALALYFASAAIAGALDRGARVSAAAAAISGIALLVWPLLIALESTVYWIAPVTAFSALLLLACFWGGPARIVYYMGLQAALIGALTAQQGMPLLVGG